jgi:hypothetical protein
MSYAEATERNPLNGWENVAGEFHILLTVIFLSSAECLLVAMIIARVVLPIFL